MTVTSSGEPAEDAVTSSRGSTTTTFEEQVAKLPVPPLPLDCRIPGIRFVDYPDESQLEAVMNLVGRDLSEPYSIFTYRYFLYRFPQLCILALDETTNEPIGCVVGKMDEEEVVLLDPPADEEQQHQESQPTQARPNKRTEWTGYIGMLAVSKAFRRQGIGKALVRLVLLRMKALQCTSATLETEVTNTTAQRLYEDCFGFLREELLLRYYLNWNDAYRLRLWF